MRENLVREELAILPVARSSVRAYDRPYTRKLLLLLQLRANLRRSLELQAIARRCDYTIGDLRVGAGRETETRRHQYGRAVRS